MTYSPLRIGQTYVGIGSTDDAEIDLVRVNCPEGPNYLIEAWVMGNRPTPSSGAAGCWTYLAGFVTPNGQPPTGATEFWLPLATSNNAALVGWGYRLCIKDDTYICLSVTGLFHVVVDFTGFLRLQHPKSL